MGGFEQTFMEKIFVGSVTAFTILMERMVLAEDIDRQNSCSFT